MLRAPKILVFDSGLGGLTVFAEVARLRPDAAFIYAADEAGFPYGDLPESVLVARVVAVMDRLISRFAPDVIVIACNTASTLVLPHLRERFALPFIGTVPAIKPAAIQSRTKLISVLATPGTVARDYTRDLVRAYAADCAVTLVGSSELASLAEAFMQGENIPDDAILREIAPAFVDVGARRTDCVVLACTHYPLLIGFFERLAPWPVEWIDPAQAIARRTDHVLTQALGFGAGGAIIRNPGSVTALFTGVAAPGQKLKEALSRRGIEKIDLDSMPLVFA
ncbi:glutamate racemase [Methylocapsa palsarum]|uniref:Glutamate racemase n=1 Tax=Methylocapsa palsarum TaxID=1612308 RepID=A0A1I3WYL5_9HYPH|nr:glutamate racemase [Methylocapsa palsarum]SFK11997.1 glutamate racemase [Methylocapsa palsarum]